MQAWYSVGLDSNSLIVKYLDPQGIIQTRTTGLNDSIEADVDQAWSRRRPQVMLMKAFICSAGLKHHQYVCSHVYIRIYVYIHMYICILNIYIYIYTYMYNKSFYIYMCIYIYII